MKIVLLTLLFVCISCKSQKKGVQHNEENGQMDEPTLVLKDNYSNIDSSQVSVIKDQKALNKFFVQVNKTRKPGLPVPEIDFTKEMMILICAGEQKGSYVPRVTIVNEDAGNMIVNIGKNQASDSTDTAMSTPFFLYKMPISKKLITFKKSDQ
ncbi:hypothetical protein OO010_14260 [Flavobacteriaceae bacterium KMM 6898]|nr:hypothetical protein [Flavobacteriaceae bacterium KMM 6898]